ncbi:MAG: DNA primase, partial [Owenweeksia sp.]
MQNNKSFLIIIGIGLSYFKERGMTDDIIRYFQLGYCPESGVALTNAALEESYQLDFLEKTGLTKVDGPRKRDRFWGRVIFPILSHTGRVLGFGGRVLKKDAKIAKYLNSPESEIYHKSKTLYGLYQAKNHLSREDECLLVEGYTDVISLYQAGVKNAVASSGTSLTVDQINLIKRYTQNVTILYDGDSAGIKASLRGIDMILEEGLNVQVLLFPDGEDPDSYSRKVSSAELADYIREEKQDFLRFKASLLLKEAGDNPLEKSRAAREIVQSIALIPDALQRDAYVKECARVLQMDEKVLFSELAQIRKSKKEKERTTRTREETPKMEVVQESQALEARSNSYKQEEALCWLLLNYGQKKCEFEMDGEKVEETVAEHIITELISDELYFDNTHFQKILEYFTETFDKEERILTAEDLLRDEDAELVKTTVDLVSEKYELHNWKSRKIFLPEKDAYIQAYT